MKTSILATILLAFSTLSIGCISAEDHTGAVIDGTCVPVVSTSLCPGSNTTTLCYNKADNNRGDLVTGCSVDVCDDGSRDSNCTPSPRLCVEVCAPATTGSVQ